MWSWSRCSCIKLKSGREHYQLVIKTQDILKNSRLTNSVRERHMWSLEYPWMLIARRTSQHLKGEAWNHLVVDQWTHNCRQQIRFRLHDQARPEDSSEPPAIHYLKQKGSGRSFAGRFVPQDDQRFLLEGRSSCDQQALHVDVPCCAQAYQTHWQVFCSRWTLL